MERDYKTEATTKASSTAGNTYALLEVARQIELLREWLISRKEEVF